MTLRFPGLDEALRSGTIVTTSPPCQSYHRGRGKPLSQGLDHETAVRIGTLARLLEDPFPPVRDPGGPAAAPSASGSTEGV